MFTSDSVKKPTVHALCILAQNFDKGTKSVAKISPNSRLRGISNIIWIPPNRGKFKLNVDALVHTQSHNSAVGGLLRDHFGFCISAFNAKIDFMSPLHAEITTIKLGLQWAMSLGYVDIQVNSDSSFAV